MKPEIIKDPDMEEFARGELENLNIEKENIEKGIEIILLPKVFNDRKNVIVEIRGVAGGDEANIFVGDLYRMYCRYAEKIGDYYTSLTTDKRFVILENGEWDIRDNHVLNISLEDDDEEELESEEEEESEYDENIEETEEDIDEVIDDDELDDDVEEDIDDLAVLDEEEIGKEE